MMIRLLWRLLWSASNRDNYIRNGLLIRPEEIQVIIVPPEYEQPRICFSRVGFDDKCVLLHLRLPYNITLLLFRFSGRLRCLLRASFTETIP